MLNLDQIMGRRTISYEKSNSTHLISLQKKRIRYSSEDDIQIQNWRLKKKTFSKKESKNNKTNSTESSYEENSSDGSIDKIEEMMQSLAISENNLKRQKLDYLDINEIDEPLSDEMKFKIIKSNKEITPIDGFKIDFILDLDQTLIFSKENCEDLKEDFSKNIFSFSLSGINFQIQLRQGLTSFFSELKGFCNFYINTLSQSNYAKSIISILKEQINDFPDIKEDNLITSLGSKTKLKTANFIKDKNKFLIFDDSLRCWEENYFDYVIPSLKFQGFTDNIQMFNADNIFNKIYQYYFSTKKIFEYDEYKRNLFNKENKLLYCMETENSKFSQLYYISKVIKKVYLLSYLMKIPLKDALNEIKKSIFKNCIFFVNFTEDQLFFIELIHHLGGKLTNDYNKSTHILFWNESKAIKKFQKEKESKIKYVNLLWLFHSYYFLTKMNENDELYSI